MTRRVRPSRWFAAIAAVALACTPRLQPLTGAPAPAVLPPATLTGPHRLQVFQWDLVDPDFTARGEGATRIAPPDSARLDFFLAGGLGTGAAVLIHDMLFLPTTADDIARRFLPPPTLLWAALGRLTVPAAPDTSARVDGDTLRVDIGQPVAWRATFVRNALWRLERVERERVVEWVQRDSARVRYRRETSHRQLDLHVTRSDTTGAFDPAIWELP